MKHMLILLITPLLLFAKTLEITPGKSIMKTMISAQPGDTIKLAPGKYHESVVVSSRVTILSDNPYNTSLVGDGRGNVVELKSGSSIVGVTVTSGGVGIYSDGRDVKISNCIVKSNLRNGIMSITSLPLIENTHIMSNSAYGIHATGIKMVPKETLLNITITKNSKGGIYYDGAIPFTLMESVLFKNGYKEVIFKVAQPEITQSIISPMTKGFEKDNLSVKVAFRALRGKNKDFRIVKSLGEKGFQTSNK